MHLNYRRLFPLIPALIFVCATSANLAQNKGAAVQPGRPIIWRDPGVIETLDFVGGPGGRHRAPKPPFTFIEESKSGTTPKIHVTDANGARWTAKFGSEVHSETFASRVAWASGYFVDSAYFVASGRIEKVGKLTRAQKYVGSDGSFTSSRFEAAHEKGVHKLEGEQSWGWLTNSMVGSKELNGLKIILMLTSNWDNKDVRDASRGSNTAIYQTPTNGGHEDRYVITDWGGSMGKWGGFTSRGKWDCRGFSSQNKDFIKDSRGDNVLFGYSGQHSESFKDGIRKSDVQWLLHYLGRITDQQLREGLQASGASTEEVTCFTHALRERINLLKAIR